jgi:hypothetical protein
MWSIDSAWFDVAVVCGIFAIGGILFGHFEEHKSKWRRVLKVFLIAGVTVLLARLGLRWVAYTLMGLLGLAAAYVHLRWLPKHGVNGWTGEPREKYYDLLRVPAEQRPGWRSGGG